MGETYVTHGESIHCDNQPIEPVTIHRYPAARGCRPNCLRMDIVKNLDARPDWAIEWCDDCFPGGDPRVE